MTNIEKETKEHIQSNLKVALNKFHYATTDNEIDEAIIEINNAENKLKEIQNI